MWSNGDVADEDIDESSPWERDDWVSDSALPDDAVFPSASPARGELVRPTTPGGGFDEPAIEEFGVHPPDSDSRSSLGRKVTAAAVVAALLIGSGGALLRSGDEADPAETPTDEGTPTESALGDLAPDATETAPSTIPPATTRIVTVPAPADTETVLKGLQLVVGEVPTWAERTIDVGPALAAMAPTEVITLSQSGIVSVTQFPSGRDRSIDVSELGADLQLAFGDRTIVVFDSTTLVQIRDGEPVVESTLSDGVIFVQPWTSTGNFVVTAPATGPDTLERDWVLRPDGSLVPLENPFVDETTFFSRVFSPDGDALVTAPGGVYAIDPAGGARRISTGTLIATGARHWAFEECDETLRCAYSIVEWDTGEVASGVLDQVEQFGFIDPTTRISPDGRSIAFRARNESGQREILDVASGATVGAGRINQVISPDAWATDSSGMFFSDQGLQFVDRSTGAATQIAALDRIRTVATGPFAADAVTE